MISNLITANENDKAFYQFSTNVSFGVWLARRWEEKTKKLEPEKVNDYIIKQKIVSAEFFYFTFQKKLTI
jgi:hypothetical protein